MAITSNCAEIIITNPQGSVSFNKLITTTELSPAKTIYSEDRVYLIQNSENVPQTFWWNLEKAIADGYADLEELYDYFVAEIANQCGGGGGSSFIPNGIKIITESCELQADDAGYFLLILRDDTELPPVVLTIPKLSPLQAGESFAIINGADLIKDKDNGVRLGDTESPICTPAINECVLFTTTNVEGVNASFLVSSFIYGDGDEGNLKTALRYLMDNVGGGGGGGGENDDFVLVNTLRSMFNY